MRQGERHRRAFDLYFRLGATRSLQALWQALKDSPSLIGLERGPSPSTLEAWSAGFHWQDKLLDLEREAAARDRQDQIKAVREMHERHVKEGLALQQRGVARLHQIADDELDASGTIRLITEGVRLERLARGEPTERVRQEGDIEIHGHIDLGRFTNQELRRLVDAAERRAGGAGEEDAGEPA